CERRRVHDLQVQLDDLLVAERVVADGRAVAGRVDVVDAVDLGGLEQQGGADLGGAQGGGRIGGEEGVAGAGGENHHAPFLEVADGAAADEVLAHFVDLDRAHDAGDGAAAFQRVLHGQCVDHRRQHA